MRSRFIELITVTASSIIELSTTLLITKIVAVQLSKDGYGFYSLILSVVALFSLLPFSSLHVGIERYIIEYKNRNKFARFYASIYLIHIVFFVLYLLLLLPLSPFLTGEWNEIWEIVYLFFITKVYKQFVFCILNINRKRISILYARIIDLSIQLILLYFFLIKGLSIQEILYASIVSSLLTIGYLVYIDSHNIYLKKVRVSDFLLVLKDVFSYSYPLIIWGIFAWIQSMIGRWFVDFYLTKSDVANFSMIFSLSLLPSTAISAIIGSYFVPIAYSNEAKSTGFIGRYINKILFAVSLVWLVIILTFLFLGEYIIVLFLDVKYLNIYWYLFWGLLGTGVYTLGQLSVYELCYYKKVKYLLLPNLLPGLLTIVGCMIIVPFWGFDGAVYVNVFTYVISGILTLYCTLYYGRKIKIIYGNC